MNHLALVPLLGGMALGAEYALGAPPKAAVSYDAFALNDGFLLSYYKKRGLKIPYHSLSEDGPVPTFDDIDIVTSVCPCSGLSTINVRAGAGCQQNKWMKVSTRWALENVRPRALVGENAHTLTSNMGRPVAQELRDIGREFGYTLSMVKTSTHLHGIPQERTRGFFILWRDTSPFLLDWQHAEYDGTWVDFLNSFEPDGEPVRDQWYDELQTAIWEYARRDFASDDELVAELVARKKSCINVIVERGDEDMSEYVEQNIESEDVGRQKLAHKLRRFLSKPVDENGKRGVWDISPCFRAEKNYKAVMWKNVATVWRPDERRPINAREQMRLMGLPEDMDIPKSYINAISQNVPTCTSRWVVSEIVEALEGRREVWNGEMSNDDILRQNNINMRLFK